MVFVATFVQLSCPPPPTRTPLISPLSLCTCGTPVPGVIAPPLTTTRFFDACHKPPCPSLGELPGVRYPCTETATSCHRPRRRCPARHTPRLRPIPPRVLCLSRFTVTGRFCATTFLGHTVHSRTPETPLAATTMTEDVGNGKTAPSSADRGHDFIRRPRILSLSRLAARPVRQRPTSRPGQPQTPCIPRVSFHYSVFP